MMQDPSPPISQVDEFEEAARQLETYGDPETFKGRLATLLKHKPVPEKSVDKV